MSDDQKIIENMSFEKWRQIGFSRELFKINSSGADISENKSSMQEEEVKLRNSDHWFSEKSSGRLTFFKFSEKQQQIQHYLSPKNIQSMEKLLDDDIRDSAKRRKS